MSGRWGITAVILLSCLFSLPGIARGAQVEAFIITDAPPSCLYNAGSPRAVTIYRLTDPQVFAWFRLTEVLAGDAPRIEWVDPAGQVRRTDQWRQVPENGTYCYTSGAFKIAEAVPPLTRGTWSVKAYIGATLLATRTFTILRPCGCSVSPASFSFEKAAGTGSVAVTADPECRRTATTTSSWIFLTSGMAGVGNGTVRFSVGMNTGSPRTGTIVILDQTVTVTQSGIATAAQVVHSRMVRSKPASCSFANPPENVTTFLTTDVEAYLWMAIDNVSVGDVLSREAFTPAGTKYAAWSSAWSPTTLSGGVCFTSSALKIAGAEPASLPGAWVAKMTMNGYPLLDVTFAIRSPVVDPVCTASLNPGSQSAPAEGGNFNVGVSTGTACSWTAASNADWISIQSGSSGRGVGTVAYRVAANASPTPRAGTLTIAGQSFTVTQSAATVCTYTIEPASVAVQASGGTGSVSVKTGSQCRWTAVSNSNWLSVTGGASGTGNGSVSFSAAANTGAAPRTGTLTIGGQTFAVQQAGPTVFAQALLSTVAGADWIFPRGDRDALDSPLGPLEGVAADASGNLYVADSANCMIFRITPDGVLSAVAGNGMCAYSGDGGRATSASISYPSDVQVDGDGNLYIADLDNHRIRKVTPDGIISTLAGTGASATSGDEGPARQAALRTPHRLAWDAAGNLYVTADRRVRRISREGIITTVAGNGETRFAGDGGHATDASFSSPEGIAVDAAGNIYVSDWNDNRIRRITTDGIINTFAGDGEYRFAGDGGPASKASLKSPAGLAFDLSGNLFVADVNNRRVRRIGSDGTISTVAGDGNL
ncbi:MAG: BACON domain-containing carbohydrate-binding protein, partial [Bryobacterales bacterium]|nr:BACON domain-containing carbohydrate-binding protein [Bryobacterales bacterium]